MDQFISKIYSKFSSLSSLDTEKIDQLINLGKEIDEDVLGQLLQIHFQSADEILLEMKSNFENKKYNDLKRCAHKFKSSCGNLGLMKMHAICHDLENTLKAELDSQNFDLVLIQDFLNCIRFEYDQTNQRLTHFAKAG